MPLLIFEGHVFAVSIARAGVVAILMVLRVVMVFFAVQFIFCLLVDDVPRVWDTGEGGLWRGDHMYACTICVLVSVLGSLVPADGSGLSAVCGVSMSVRVIVCVCVCVWWVQYQQCCLSCEVSWR
jgi:hypothetical protein